MSTMENFFIAHMIDLSRRSETQDIFTFTSFLTPEEQSELLLHRKELTHFSFFGGAPGTERNVARFGDPEALGYEVPWDVVCLRISPRGAKFAEPLTHRDFLGTLMGTGLERDRIGDIVVRDGTAYVFTDEKTARYLCDTLDRVRHTAVDAAVEAQPPAGELYRTETIRCIAASLRADGVTGAVFRLSRGAAAELFRQKKIFINGAQCENPAKAIREGDVISVRGYGKFRFRESVGSTKKDRVVFEADKYV